MNHLKPAETLEVIMKASETKASMPLGKMIIFGIFASGSEVFTALSGIGSDALSNLTWTGMMINNLLPVTIGNIIGGAICVASGYYAALKSDK